MFRQGVPELGLSIESGTENVPDDGSYHVVHHGRVVFSSASKVKALREYQRRRDELMGGIDRGSPTIDYGELLRRERALADVQSMRGGKGAKPKLRVPGRRGHR